MHSLDEGCWSCSYILPIMVSNMRNSFSECDATVVDLREDESSKLNLRTMVTIVSSACRSSE